MHVLEAKKNRYKYGETGSVRISGIFKGQIIGAENVLVTTTGSCNCNISAKKIFIDGEVKGNINVETLIINSGKLFYDQVKTSRLLMANRGFIAHISNTDIERIPENCTTNSNETAKKRIKELVETYKTDDGVIIDLKSIRLYMSHEENCRLGSEKDEECKLQSKDNADCFEPASITTGAERNSSNKKEYRVRNTAQQFYCSY